MKALKIHESQSFKRGKNPHRSLEIGEYKRKNPDDVKDDIFWIWDKYFDNRTKQVDVDGRIMADALIEVGTSNIRGANMWVFFLDQDTINTELDDEETAKFLDEIKDELEKAKYGYEIEYYEFMEIRINREKNDI